MGRLISRGLTTPRHHYDMVHYACRDGVSRLSSHTSEPALQWLLRLGFSRLWTFRPHAAAQGRKVARAQRPARVAPAHTVSGYSASHLPGARLLRLRAVEHSWCACACTRAQAQLWHAVNARPRGRAAGVLVDGVSGRGGKAVSRRWRLLGRRPGAAKRPLTGNEGRGVRRKGIRCAIQRQQPSRTPALQQARAPQCGRQHAPVRDHATAGVARGD